MEKERPYRCLLRRRRIVIFIYNTVYSLPEFNSGVVCLIPASSSVLLSSTKEKCACLGYSPTNLVGCRSIYWAYESIFGFDCPSLGRRLKRLSASACRNSITAPRPGLSTKMFVYARTRGDARVTSRKSRRDVAAAAARRVFRFYPP
ncbi:hypothetical protein EVAR_85299_1 [Eumeta japonica]|uniref:Uncharacterized protein n=1 Tax=Eumeta variegata TaxID=151549 RepID=A0A4C1V7C8_EUMVA|nr:hypothetical protein EVAR_85299_1 [Eumeta japonica]